MWTPLGDCAAGELGVNEIMLDHLREVTEMMLWRPSARRREYGEGVRPLHVPREGRREVAANFAEPAAPRGRGHDAVSPVGDIPISLPSTRARARRKGVEVLHPYPLTSAGKSKFDSRRGSRCCLHAGAIVYLGGHGRGSRCATALDKLQTAVALELGSR